MSYIVLPDEHPGRCKNVRSHTHPNGHAETLRCLDYEGKPHVCSFPEPQYVYIDTTSWGGQLSSSTPAKPKPWVKPS